MSSLRSKPSDLASSALAETFAMATVSNTFFSDSNGSSGFSCAARTASSFGPPPAGSRPTPASTETDVAFQRRDGARRMHLEFAATTEGEAAHGRHDGHQRILDAHAGGLEVRHHRLELGELARLQQAERTLEVRAEPRTARTAARAPRRGTAARPVRSHAGYRRAPGR